MRFSACVRNVSTLRRFGEITAASARVASQALGGEVLVSNLARELVAGPGVEFLEGREVELKGLEGSHRLFAVALAWAPPGRPWSAAKLAP